MAGNKELKRCLDILQHLQCGNEITVREVSIKSYGGLKEEEITFGGRDFKRSEGTGL